MTGFPKKAGLSFLRILPSLPSSTESRLKTASSMFPVGSYNNVNTVLANEQSDLLYGTVVLRLNERKRGDRDRVVRRGIDVCGTFVISPLLNGVYNI